MTSALLPGHPHIARRGNDLYIEGVALNELARSYGTPLFAYSKASMLSALSAYQRGFAGRKAKICYAMKANSSLAVLQVFAQAGCGFDIVSGGELDRVLAASGKAADVIFSGVGKTRAEMQKALDAGIGCFNVESEAELEVLSAVASAAGKTAPVSIRVNPNVDPKTHPYISTGLKGNKFGVAHERTLDTYKRAAALPGAQGRGHRLPHRLADHRRHALPGRHGPRAGPGGGDRGRRHPHPPHRLRRWPGHQLQRRRPPAADALWASLFAKLDARGFGGRQFMIEPGRSLVGNAGVCLSEVLYLKPGEQKNFCIIDAAMNDLPRPAMYQAFHAIEPVTSRDETFRSLTTWWAPCARAVTGSAATAALSVQPGDLVAVLSAGAYCMSMASNYNTRGRAAEVLVDGERVHLIRERETAADQMRGERLVS
jgi:diaminopimelate decarboxylase